jgi:hypothetical protein
MLAIFYLIDDNNNIDSLSSIDGRQGGKVDKHRERAGKQQKREILGDLYQSSEDDFKRRGRVNNNNKKKRSASCEEGSRSDHAKRHGTRKGW